MQEDQKSIPDLFRCPISLDLLKDPVILCTGQTYDRSSIEKWLATGNLTCPITMKKLHDPSMVPNHTLRHLIQQWLQMGSGFDPNSITTVDSLISLKTQLQSPHLVLKNKLLIVQRVRNLSKDSSNVSSCMIELGFLPLLLELVFAQSENLSHEHLEFLEVALCCIVKLYSLGKIEALSILKQESKISSFVVLFEKGTNAIKARLCDLIEAISSSSEGEDVCETIANSPKLLKEIIALVRQKDFDLSNSGAKAIFSLCKCESNMENLVREGAEIGQLEYISRAGAERQEKRLELSTMAALEKLLEARRGKEELKSRPLKGINALVKMMFRVSDYGEGMSESAVNSLMILCSESVKAREEAIREGVLSQLLLLLQSQCSVGMKDKARMFLKLLRSKWDDDYMCRNFEEKTIMCGSDRTDRTRPCEPREMKNVNGHLNLSVSVFIVLLLWSFLPMGAAQNAYESPAASALFSDLVNRQISNFTSVFKDDIKKNFGFCITDVDSDWNEAFNFSKNTGFLSACAKKTKGDFTQRLCTAAEIKFFFNSFFSSGSTAKKSNYLKPNKNCNLSSWVSGCEPGWACTAEHKVDLKNSKDVPSRTSSCGPCCDGFFCPHGITCMIPCPLGAYCPLAKLNKTSGVCEPYRYQLPQGQPNHTCGGADVWADILSSSEVFCSAGSYCPTTVEKLPCSSGHYCRTGSTSQQQCLKMATCETKSANQNITAYGAMFFAGLSFLLIIIYNCSDQVLSTRERRQAKSREKAVQSVRETTQAREKWKSAKDVAKKHAVELQTQLSRTFSRRKSMKQPELLKGLSQAKGANDAAFQPFGASGASQQSSSNSKGKKKEKSNLTKMLNDIEQDPDNPEGFNLEIGDKNIKKQAPKGRQLHTQSQIFKYAYGQIEREKALQEQNKNLTFSGVISMASDIEIAKRPTIEVAFKDLTLTLKGKKKHLMRCVTGKIMPGRVSAVMGPSGAGKTTFLSALAGKATGCTMSGMILINGKNESIHSYKKIIGFVPQDDIVHGNLTVEENLWFSARCRLSADLPKPEKVLVVERVIESLGLQAVRDSLVGTVEKRGISGGQRKRVNVGLEMVMEPSLLILDEPTSGLDSSSSQLLLKALRREALEGVNICMVVHQPSYTLFRMFDDLILLAKGGLTAYHGSVKKVEEYFASLGMTVPERVNPPDYFIDILEGVVKPSTSSGINYKQLPVRWMLHNGYPVPMDMLQGADGIAAAAEENSAHGGNAAGSDAQSFAGEFWQDVKCNVELKRDNIQHNFLKSSDLSDRKTPGVFTQYKYFLGRLGKQRLREARPQAVDYLILLLAGICLGTLAKVSDETFGSLGYTYTVIAVSLLCKIAALRSFSLDKLHYWRESASGMSSLAYFLAKDTIDHFNTIIKPLVYLSMFYFFNNPRSSVTDNYIVLFCLVYCVTGIAYALAIFLEPAPAQLWSVLLPVVLTLIATHNDDNKLVDSLADLCYTKWALEAFVIANARKYFGVWLITRCGSLQQSGYDLNHWYRCLVLLILFGMFMRGIAFFCMVTFKKK